METLTFSLIEFCVLLQYLRIIPSFTGAGSLTLISTHTCAIRLSLILAMVSLIQYIDTWQRMNCNCYFMPVVVDYPLLSCSTENRWFHLAGRLFSLGTDTFLQNPPFGPKGDPFLWDSQRTYTRILGSVGVGHWITGWGRMMIDNACATMQLRLHHGMAWIFIFSRTGWRDAMTNTGGWMGWRTESAQSVWVLNQLLCVRRSVHLTLAGYCEQDRLFLYGWDDWIWGGGWSRPMFKKKIIFSVVYHDSASSGEDNDSDMDMGDDHMYTHTFSFSLSFSCSPSFSLMHSLSLVRSFFFLCLSCGDSLSHTRRKTNNPFFNGGMGTERYGTKWYLLIKNTVALFLLMFGKVYFYSNTQPQRYSAHEQDLSPHVKWAKPTNEILSRMKTFILSTLML